MSLVNIISNIKCLFRILKCVLNTHQATAVFAADATARLSGTVGVAVVTAGPGVTNTVTALKNAQMAESPIILIGTHLIITFLKYFSNTH